MLWNGILLQSLCPQPNVSFNVWLNYYFQRTLPGAHMAGPYLPLLQPNSQYHHYLSFAQTQFLLQGQKRGWLQHVHLALGREHSRGPGKADWQVFLTAAPPPGSPCCSKPPSDGQATLALEKTLPA